MRRKSYQTSVGMSLQTTSSKNDGKIRFSIPEGINKQVAVLCADCSIGADGSTNVKAYSYKGDNSILKCIDTVLRE